MECGGDRTVVIPVKLVIAENLDHIGIPEILGKRAHDLRPHGIGIRIIHKVARLNTEIIRNAVLPDRLREMIEQYLIFQLRIAHHKKVCIGAVSFCGETMDLRPHGSVADDIYVIGILLKARKSRLVEKNGVIFRSVSACAEFHDRAFPLEYGK